MSKSSSHCNRSPCSTLLPISIAPIPLREPFALRRITSPQELPAFLSHSQLPTGAALPISATSHSTCSAHAAATLSSPRMNQWKDCSRLMPPLWHHLHRSPRPPQTHAPKIMGLPCLQWLVHRPSPPTLSMHTHSHGGHRWRTINRHVSLQTPCHASSTDHTYRSHHRSYMGPDHCPSRSPRITSRQTRRHHQSSAATSRRITPRSCPH